MSNYNMKTEMQYTEVLENFSIVEEPQYEFKFNPNKSVFKKEKTFKVVSLFSGCGGLDLGFNGGFNFRNLHFKKNNFKIDFANDKFIR